MSRHLRSALSGTAFVVALSLPKCPLCVAAWSATLGVSAAGQKYLLDWSDPLYQSELIGLLVLPLLLQIGLALCSRMLGRRVRIPERRAFTKKGMAQNFRL
jgi:hypothetical protein